MEPFVVHFHQNYLLSDCTSHHGKDFSEYFNFSAIQPGTYDQMLFFFLTGSRIEQSARQSEYVNLDLVMMPGSI